MRKVINKAPNYSIDEHGIIINRTVNDTIIDAIIKLHESGMSREEIRYIVTY